MLCIVFFLLLFFFSFASFEFQVLQISRRPEFQDIKLYWSEYSIISDSEGRLGVEVARTGGLGWLFNLLGHRRHSGTGEEKPP